MPRRKSHTKGEGEYWQDKSDRHHYRITVNGRAYEVANKDPDRAKARFEDLKQSLRDKVDVVGGRQSYSQFLTRYLTTTVPNEVRKESTVHDYAKRAGLYILPTLGPYRLDALTTELGLAWRNAMIDNGWALNSVKQALALAKRSLDQAVNERLIPYNPFASIKPPVTDNRPVDREDDMEEESDGIGKVMNLEQIEAFMKAIENEWLQPLYVLAFLSPRRGELLGLRWKDYDRENKLIRIRQQVIQLDGKVHITTPKTRKSRRSIYLTDEYVEMLDRHYIRWLELKMKHRDKWQDDYDLMFCTRYGTPYEPSNLLRNFRQALVRAGLTDFRFHDIRHTANQTMKDAGVDAKVRAAILGHASIKVTESVYSHVSEDAKRDAINRVGRKKQG